MLGGHIFTAILSVKNSWLNGIIEISFESSIWWWPCVSWRIKENASVPATKDHLITCSCKSLALRGALSVSWCQTPHKAPKWAAGCGRWAWLWIIHLDSICGTSQTDASELIHHDQRWTETEFNVKWDSSLLDWHSLQVSGLNVWPQILVTHPWFPQRGMERGQQRLSWTHTWSTTCKNMLDKMAREYEIEHMACVRMKSARKSCRRPCAWW